MISDQHEMEKAKQNFTGWLLPAFLIVV